MLQVTAASIWSDDAVQIHRRVVCGPGMLSRGVRRIVSSGVAQDAEAGLAAKCPDGNFNFSQLAAQHLPSNFNGSAHPGDADELKKLIKKWRPYVSGLQKLSAPGGYKDRNLYIKMAWDACEVEVACVLEAMYAGRVPPEVRAGDAVPRLVALNKCNADGTIRGPDDVRPIGMKSCVARCAARPLATEVAERHGHRLSLCGQWGSGKRCGVEVVASAIQLMMELDGLMCCASTPSTRRTASTRSTRSPDRAHGRVSAQSGVFA